MKNICHLLKSPADKKRDIKGNPKRNITEIFTCTNNTRNSTKEEDDEVVSTLLDSSSMPIYCIIDWSKFLLAKKMQFDQLNHYTIIVLNDNHVEKKYLFLTQGIKIDDSMRLFEFHNDDHSDEEQRDNDYSFCEQVLLIASNDNFYSMWNENSYLSNDERDNNGVDNYNAQCIKIMRLQVALPSTRFIHMHVLSSL